MKLDQVSVNETLDKAKALLAKEKKLSLAMRTMFELLILLIGAFVGRLSKNSSNSSKPPSTDKNRKRGSKNGESSKKTWRTKWP